MVTFLLGLAKESNPAASADGSFAVIVVSLLRVKKRSNRWLRGRGL
ncbi:hypothetical protein GLA29479_3557 [Lysobacter antibioticus]|nr:hypothetical protein GLA29479_3557 [Lysobacter antibioticus]